MKDESLHHLLSKNVYVSDYFLISAWFYSFFAACEFVSNCVLEALSGIKWNKYNPLFVTLKIHARNECRNDVKTVFFLEAHAENATRNFNHMFDCAVNFSTVS